MNHPKIGRPRVEQYAARLHRAHHRDGDIPATVGA